jgi:2,5-diamino-6-(ribosylamino)-4(3H)-pyrimidinone 5'-phosphate reductase
VARSRVDVRPVVTLVGAMSLDGKIASRTGDSQISSLSDLRALHRLRSKNDAVMIGVGTLLQDNPRLTVRCAKGKNPIRIIVDGSARTPPNSRIFLDGGPVIVAVTNRASNRRVDRLRKAGADVLRTGNSHVNLRILLARAYRLGIRSILLEGGGRLNWSMLSNRLVDDIRILVAPIIIGGSRATTLVDGEGVGRISHAISLIPVSVRRHGEETVLSYKVK